MQEYRTTESSSLEEYFIRHNYVIMVGGPAIALGSSLFWIISNAMCQDMYCFVSSGAIWAITLLILASIAMIIIEEKCHSEGNYNKKEIDLLERSSMVYFLILFVAVAMIIGAGNLQAVNEGISASVINVSLSSTLLILSAVAPVPKKSYGIILLCAAVITLFIPYLMQGSEVYAILPEAVLRFAIAAGYFVIWMRTANAYRMEQHVIALKNSMEESNDEVIDMLVNAVEIRDTESGEHTKRVKNLTKVLATEIMNSYPEYGLTPQLVELITRASGMHDIGKILIPDEILLKPGKLNKEEWEIMKSHSEKGCKLLEQAPTAWGEELTRLSREICLYHHEKYDGKGYPMGLAGDDIPIWAQIVSVADCYEALTGERSYKEPFPPETAYNMISNGECGAFSDKILDSLSRVKSQYEDMINQK